MTDEMEGIKRGFARRLRATGSIAASAAGLAVRRVVGRAAGAADERLGLRLAAELDEMKGMAMKVGQILSYFDGILPEEAHRALRSLQRGTKPVAFESMAAVIEQEFGESHEHLYESFDPVPIAAASIGQVYRARYAGTDVAVKVQYPGIRETIVADFSRLHQVAGLASLATAVDGHALVEELEQRFSEECDYVREAAHQDAFARAFAHDVRVHVPRVVHARTRTRVLTSAWCEGSDFYAFVQRGSQSQRDDVGLQLAAFALRSLYEFSAVNADPHPGNYLIRDDGTVVFLDFGCVRRFTDGFLQPHRRLVEVVVRDQRAGFRDALEATGMVADAKFDFDEHWRLLCYELAAYRVANFEFTREYIMRGREFTGATNPNLRRLRIGPEWIWVERLLWGLHAVLARLGARGDFRSVLLAALAAPRRTLPLEP